MGRRWVREDEGVGWGWDRGGMWDSNLWSLVVVRWEWGGGGREEGQGTGQVEFAAIFKGDV